MMTAAGLTSERDERAFAAADWTAIGTQVRLVVTDPAQLNAGKLLLEHEIAELDLACSRFRPDSELALVERVAPAPAHVGPVLADAIGAALHAAAITDGDLDPTIATSLAALGYDRDFELIRGDGPAVHLTVGNRMSWRQVRFDGETSVLALPMGARLDLGATAKARAADRAAALLEQRLDCGVLVSLGGDIAVRGTPPSGGWQVRVQDQTGHPDDPPGDQAATVALAEGGMATSSTTARRWRRGNTVLHHIIDPRSGQPAPPVWRTVTVLASTALGANIASTTAIIRGQGALAWLDSLGLPARLVAVDGAIRTMGGWPKEAQKETQEEAQR